MNLLKRNHLLSAAVLIVFTALTFSCGGGQVRYEMGRAKNIQRVAVIDVSMMDSTDVNSVNETYGKLGQLIMIDSLNMFVRQIKQQLHWQVLPPAKVLNSAALKRFNQQYEKAAKGKYSFLYSMSKKQTANLKGTKNLVGIGNTPELKKIVAELCDALRIDGIVMISLSYSNSSTHNNFSGHTSPCVSTSISLYDRKSTLVVGSYALGDYDSTCSKKKFKLSRGLASMRFTMTEDYVKEMIISTRNTIPETVARVKKALDKYKREQAQLVKTRALKK